MIGNRPLNSVGSDPKLQAGLLH